MWRPTPLYRALGLEQALGTDCTHLLQVRGRLARPARTSRTPPCRRRTTTARRASRGLATETGAGPVGLVARLRGRAVRPRGQGLHGARVVRREAVPPLDDGDLGRAVRAEPVAGHERRRAASWPRPGLQRLAGHRDLRGRRGRRHARRHEVRARLGAQPRAAAPDGDRPGGEEAARAGRRLPGRRHRLHRRRLATSPASRSRSWPTRSPAARSAIVAAEPAACPSLTRGHYGYDFGDTAQIAPLLPMHTLGHGFVPEPIHAGGLRYHGMAPLVSHLVQRGPGRGRRLRPERVLPRGRPLRPHRGHHPGARAVARDPRGRGRGRARPRRRARADDPLQPVRPRALRPLAPTTRTWPASWRTARCRRRSSTAPPRCSRGCRRSGSPSAPGRQVVDRSASRTSLARSGPERQAGRLSEGSGRSPPGSPVGNQAPLRGTEMSANCRLGSLVARGDRAGDECCEVGLERRERGLGGCTSCGRPRSRPS